MTDEDPFTELSGELRRYFAATGSVDGLTVDTAKALFDVHHADQRLAELIESTVAVRGDGDDDTLRFAFGERSILVTRSLGAIRVLVHPDPDAVFVESTEGRATLDLGGSGLGTMETSGVVRIVAVFGDETLVTDPFVVGDQT